MYIYSIYIMYISAFILKKSESISSLYKYVLYINKKKKKKGESSIFIIIYFYYYYFYI